MEMSAMSLSKLYKLHLLLIAISNKLYSMQEIPMLFHFLRKAVKNFLSVFTLMLESKSSPT